MAIIMSWAPRRVLLSATRNTAKEPPVFVTCLAWSIRVRGSKFEKARELLRGPYRAALAHAGQVDVGKPLTGAYYDDYQKVADKVTIVRYMANVTLENVRATFDAQADG